MTRTTISATVLVAAALGVSGLAQHSPLDPTQTIVMPKLEVTVPDFSAAGLILDIGGGGEGIIGQVKGRQVVAVDIDKQELEDAPGGPLLKIVMDGRELKFLDRTFATSTAFFSFMYIWSTDHSKVLAEIYRVLEPGGRLLVWDVVFPPREADPNKHNVSYSLRINLPGGKRVDTGYGVHRLPPFGRGAREMIIQASAVGFELVKRQDERGWYFLELRKPR